MQENLRKRAFQVWLRYLLTLLVRTTLIVEKLGDGEYEEGLVIPVSISTRLITRGVKHLYGGTLTASL